MSAEQMNLLGLPASEAPVAGAAPLSPSQKEIFRLARRESGITAAEAGRILHSARNGGRGCRPERKPPSATAPAGASASPRSCCPWMGSDGWDVLKRLRERGLVHQPTPRGPYFAVPTTLEEVPLA